MLLRLLIYDRHYACRCDIHHGEADDGVEKGVSIHSPAESSSSSSQPLTISDKRSTFTVTSKPFPDMSKLHLHDKAVKRKGGNDHPPTDSRLIIGSCFSLRSVLSRLSLDKEGVDKFYWDCSDYRLLYYGSPTGWKFIALLSMPCRLDCNRLVEYYEKVFVPFFVKSPLYYHSKTLSSAMINSEGFCSTSRLFFTTPR